MSKSINILGTEYTIEYKNPETDIKLKDLDGYCDTSIKKIVVDELSVYDPLNIEDLEKFKKKVIRHEAIHAFLYESGLGVNCDWVCEEMVDWIAIQSPKIFEEFKKIDLL